MKRTFGKLALLCMALVTMIVVMCFSASASTSGKYTYEVEDGAAVITDVDESISGNVTIPSKLGGYTVNRIGVAAFENCLSIKTVVVPDNVKTMDSYAFQNCSGLTSVTIGSGVKEIGYGTFDGCVSLKTVKLGKNITDIGINAFYSCKSLEEIVWNSSLRQIGENAFYECISLTSLDFPSSLSDIGAYAFYGCSGIVNVKFKNNLSSIGNGSFEGCIALKTVTIPDSTKSIGWSAFAENSSLTTVTIGDGVTSIGSDAFKNAISLTKVKIGNSVAEIDTGAFSNCSSLTTVVVPDSVKTLKSGAFKDCVSLDKIALSKKLAEIEPEVFDGCKTLKSILIPEMVTSIGSSAFRGCEKLEKIYIPKNMSDISYSTFYGCNSLKEVYYGGNADDWSSMNIDDENNAFTMAKINYKHKHSFSDEIVPATTSANGSINSTCTVCEGYSVAGIAKIKSVSLSATKYIYDGNNKTPKVTVEDVNGETLVKNTDYTISVSSKRSAIGRHTVKITFKGKYKGTQNVYFYIRPAAPTSPKASSQTTTSVKLSWSAVKGAAGYKVYRYSPSKKEYVYVGATTKTYATVKELLKGTAYTFRVYAYGKTSAGKVYDSSKYLLIKTATCTATPTLKLASTAKGRATIAWSNVAGETGYQVYYATSKTGTYKKIANYSANTTKAYKTGLTSGKTYYFKVRAYTKTDSGYVYSAYSTVGSLKIK